jgi:hypothetical protein
MRTYHKEAMLEWSMYSMDEIIIIILIVAAVVVVVVVVVVA